MGVEFDEATRRSFDPIFEQVRARQLAKEQVSAELQDLRKSVEDSFDPGSRARAKTRLQEVQAEFPHERKVRDACEEVVRVLDARGEEHERILAELSKIAEAVKHVPLSESTDLLRRAARISSNFSMEPQVGALIQQIEYEVNRRLAQRQALIEEMAQLESAFFPGSVDQRAIPVGQQCALGGIGRRGGAGRHGRSRSGESGGRGSPSDNFPPAG